MPYMLRSRYKGTIKLQGFSIDNDALERKRQEHEGEKELHAEIRLRMPELPMFMDPNDKLLDGEFFVAMDLSRSAAIIKSLQTSVEELLPIGATNATRGLLTAPPIPAARFCRS
jgi:hypothetical protein